MDQMNDKLYRSGDMVRIGCDDCRGCDRCCRGMGNSIVLNPYDVFELCRGTGTDFQTLFVSKLELKVQDGIVLPNIRMTEPDMKCGFLSEEGRCTVHAFRPGLCRLFPLGRQYSEGSLSYFVLEDACPNSSTKIKIDKWLGISDLKRHEQFLIRWHYLVKERAQDVQAIMREDAEGSDDLVLQKNMELFQLFYVTPYDLGGDFYEQFEQRILKI